MKYRGAVSSAQGGSISPEYVKHPHTKQQTLQQTAKQYLLFGVWVKRAKISKK